MRDLPARLGYHMAALDWEGMRKPGNFPTTRAMVTIRSENDTTQHFTSDVVLLFLTRFVRLFAYGSLSVVLVFYLTDLGLSTAQTGVLFTLTLVGDTVISFYLTTRADRIGRRRMLMVGAALMIAAGAIFATSHNFLLLTIAATIGVISPSGNEVGPFLSIEQAALSTVISDQTRTQIFAWYTLAGSFATALGALATGAITHAFEKIATPLGGYRTIVVLYATLGVVLLSAFYRLTPAAEVNLHESPDLSAGLPKFIGVGHSYHVVLKLSGLFALDSFGGGFVVQSFAAYWFYLRFGLTPASLGIIFFVANILSGVSALLASRLASRIGLVRTMVFTHLPSNILLILIPLMPNLSLAVAVLFLRFSISQMDVPTRQSYTMAVVPPHERSAAAGITGVSRTTGASLAPVLAGFMFARPSLISAPFFIAGSLKIVYDLLLYKSFSAIKPPEETETVAD
jgi:MFS family permease